MTQITYVIQVNKDCDKTGVFDAPWHDIGNHDLLNDYQFPTLTNARETIERLDWFLPYQSPNWFLSDRHPITKDCLRIIKRTITEEVL